MSIERHKGHYALKTMCKALKVSKSGFLRWKIRPPNPRIEGNAHLAARIREVFQASKQTYGSPRLHAALVQAGKSKISVSKIARLMKLYHLRAKTKRRFRPSPKLERELSPAPHVLDRDFNPSRPNMVWAQDITYISIQSPYKWLYLAIVMDLFSRKIVGWSMSINLDQSLVLEALRMAFRTRQPEPGLIVHSDQGSQYSSKAYRQLLKNCGAVISMSRKGNCWDNSVVESFFGALKQELVFFESYSSPEEAMKSIFLWIEGWYNPHRLHSTLGNISPIDYESRSVIY